MLGIVFGKLKGWLALGGVAIIAIFVAFLRGRHEGKKLIEAEQSRQRIKAIKKKAETDEKVRKMDRSTRRGKLREWMRGDGR